MRIVICYSMFRVDTKLFNAYCSFAGLTVLTADFQLCESLAQNTEFYFRINCTWKWKAIFVFYILLFMFWGQKGKSKIVGSVSQMCCSFSVFAHLYYLLSCVLLFRNSTSYMGFSSWFRRNVVCGSYVSFDPNSLNVNSYCSDTEGPTSKFQFGLNLIHVVRSFSKLIESSNFKF